MNYSDAPFRNLSGEVVEEVWEEGSLSVRVNVLGRDHILHLEADCIEGEHSSWASEKTKMATPMNGLNGELIHSPGRIRNEYKRRESYNLESAPRQKRKLTTEQKERMRLGRLEALRKRKERQVQLFLQTMKRLEERNCLPKVRPPVPLEELEAMGITVSYEDKDRLRRLLRSNHHYLDCRKELKERALRGELSEESYSDEVILLRVNTLDNLMPDLLIDNVDGRRREKIRIGESKDENLKKKFVAHFFENLFYDEKEF